MTGPTQPQTRVGPTLLVHVLACMALVAGCGGNDSAAVRPNASTTGSPSKESGTVEASTSAATTEDTGSQCDEPWRCAACVPPGAPSCAAPTDDLRGALGLACAGDDVTLSLDATADQHAITNHFGGTSRWTPLDGGSFAVLGTGRAQGLAQAPVTTSGASYEQFYPCAANDPSRSLTTLPAPLTTTTSAGSCADDLELVGTGDCSSTLSLAEGAMLSDYAALHLRARVPDDITGLAFDVAVVSEEFPSNRGADDPEDLVVAWLQSRRWSGNVLFDGQGRLLGPQSPLFSIRDSANSSSHPAGIPELFGTCAESNGATPWLTTQVPVSPGETIDLVFFVAEVNEEDAETETFLFLDNVRWTCSDDDVPSTSFRDLY